MSQPLDELSQPLFAAAFREHHSSLLRYLRRRVGSDADAHDIAQEAYLSLLRYRDNQDLSSLKALLFRIATNLVGMRARVARSRSWANHCSFDEQEQNLSCDSPSHEQRLFGEQQLELLMEAIQGLPTKCQQVFILSRFHDMSYPEIAARSGITVKMVEKHVAKALAICRTKVGNDLR
jgi:RNA polymerase sigma factor (sigma-70 family)